MRAQPDIAAAAALFGDPARAAMLTALLDRQELPAGELALAANVSPQTASFHLAKLTSAALLASRRRGRNHVYHLAGPAVAGAIESLAALSSAVLRPHPSDRFHSERMRQLRAGRTCYDHLAGIAGVVLHDCLFTRGYLEPKGPKEYALTRKGRTWYAEIGGPTDYSGRDHHSRVRVSIGANNGRTWLVDSPHSYWIVSSPSGGLQGFTTREQFGSPTMDGASSKDNTVPV